MNFADRLHASIEKSRSFIVAGFDPVIEGLPPFIVKEAARASTTDEEAVYQALISFHTLAIEALAGSIAAIKPNFGFFVQYGLGGLRAFDSICRMAQDLGLPVIADAKVGDIGNTAKAYSAAFLGQSRFASGTHGVFAVDALTVNPFLGFDTLEPFLQDCRTHGKGIFVLVKTSNPGSAEVQNAALHQSGSICEKVARWIGENGKELLGNCGYSSLGAVVGATYPHEARQLRSLMPDNIFLIPGMGAQGGSAVDAVQGFSARGAGAIINLSRALLGSFPQTIDRAKELSSEIKRRATQFNAEIADALKQV